MLRSRKPKKTFVVSYLIIFAFLLALDIKRVIVKRSFGHSKEKVTSFNYLTRDEIDFKDNKNLLQLRDFALAVAAKNNKIAISEIFTLQS